uniref:CSON013883 protein n=1 Tax=Culicoides sonorensis TaxID=179676 RepID=A0A336MEP8_CULSO
MSDTVEFSFILNKQNSTYNAGETIKYKIIATVHKSFKARQLTVRFKGLAHVEWKSGKNSRYRDLEVFFKDVTVLWTSVTGSEQINPGTYEYSGTFCLPENIPTSYKHEVGYIEYNIKANYDVPFGKDLFGKHEFYVQNYLKLKDYSSHKEPSNNVVEERFSCCGLFKSEPLKIVVFLPKTIWIAGETIPIKLEVSNNSDVVVKKIKVKLIESIEFTGKGYCLDTNHKYENNTMFKRKFETSLSPLQNKEFEASFTLDKFHSYINSADCQIIESSYHIEAIAILKGWRMGVANTTKIYITKVPDSDMAEIE